MADRSNHRIQVFDSQGSFLTKWGSKGAEDGQFEFPMDVEVDQFGNALVVDRNNERLQAFEPDGTFRLSWSTAGEKQGPAFFPLAISVDGLGRVYVRSSSDIQVFQGLANGG